jgi:hypothetical protein
LLLLVQPSIASSEKGGGLSWTSLLRYGAIVAAMLTTITPWVLRNVYNFGVPVVTARGGDILGFRALLSEQSPSDWFYYFSPAYVRPTVTKIVGHASFDEIADRYSYLKKNRWKIYQKRMEAQGLYFDKPNAQTEARIARDAIRYFAADPDRYVVNSLLFFYRGTWFLDGAMLPGEPRFLRNAVFWINGLGMLTLIVTVFWAVLRRDAELTAAFALAAGSFAFYSLFSHYMPRYSDASAPFLFICVFWWIIVTGQTLRLALVRASRGTLSGLLSPKKK